MNKLENIATMMLLHEYDQLSGLGWDRWEKAKQLAKTKCIDLCTSTDEMGLPKLCAGHLAILMELEKIQFNK